MLTETREELSLIRRSKKKITSIKYNFDDHSRKLQYHSRKLKDTKIIEEPCNMDASRNGSRKAWIITDTSDVSHRSHKAIVEPCTMSKLTILEYSRSTFLFNFMKNLKKNPCFICPKK